MSEHHDEHELLALIEGDLAPEQEARLRARLAGSDPKTLHLIDRMRADRALLRSMPEPPLPEDFLAEVEPVLARPMLIPPPEEVRRRVRLRRAGRRRAGPILLAAAGLALAAGAGIWATTLLLPRNPAVPEKEFLAASDSAAAPLEARLPLTGPPAPLAPEAPPIGSQDSGVPMQRAARPDERARLPGPGAPVAAGIALVIEAADTPHAERLLEEALARIDRAATALVRNLDQAEADALTEQWHRARARGGERAGEAPVASANGQTPSGASRRQPVPPTIDRAALQSRQLAGPAELAPSYEQQLGFSGKGATHTIAVPAEKLADLLALLADGGQVTTLRLLEARASGGAAPHWDAYADVRRAAAELLEQSRGGVILLPVEVRPSR